MATCQPISVQLEEHWMAMDRLFQQHRLVVDNLLSQHMKLLEERVNSVGVARTGISGSFDTEAFSRSCSDLHHLAVVPPRLSSGLDHELDGSFSTWRSQCETTSDVGTDSDEDCTSKITATLRSGLPVYERLVVQQIHDYGTIKPSGRIQSCLLPIVSSSLFQVVVFLLIVLNAIFLGVEVHLKVTNSLEGKHEHEDVISAFRSLEVVFLAFFTLEMALRLLAERGAFFYGPNRWWNVGEGLIVFICILDQVQDRLHSQTWTATIFIRNLRIFRAVRVIRIFRFLRQLRLMLFSILSCFISFSWALLLMLIMLAAFAMYLEDVILVHFNRPEHLDRNSVAFFELKKHWQGVDVAFRSLIYSVTGGSDWADLAEPFWAIEPTAGMCYIAFILFIVFGLLNVLVGIFVEQNGEIAQWDQQAVLETAASKQGATHKVLTELFYKMATKEEEGSHARISLEALRRGLKDQRIKAYLTCLQIDMMENAEVFFELLDEDRSGYVDKDEFVEGCVRLQGGAKGLDLAKLYLETRKTQQKVDSLDNKLGILMTGASNNFDRGNSCYSGFAGSSEWTGK